MGQHVHSSSEGGLLRSHQCGFFVSAPLRFMFNRELHLQAVFHDTSHAIIYSPNDIVVKVGNGIFKPKKEIDMFNAIRRRTAKPNAADSSFKTLVSSLPTFVLFVMLLPPWLRGSAVG